MKTKARAKQIEMALRPETGWIESYAQATVRNEAKRLLDAGADPQTVENALSAVIGAIRGEYGD